MKAVA
ncbi:protein of unknown function [Streptantibioticus cattleyicolor NRRL 8057 = DSM 46488]